MTVKPHRRFIAGAVCPRCGKMDKIVVDMETRTRECIDCGFSEGRPADNTSTVELPTRVSRPAARRVETPAEVINLVDPAAEKSAE